MKIRKGFVSNSSSSSFVALAKSVKKEEIMDYDNVHLFGDYINEGLDIFLLTDEMKKFILADEEFSSDLFQVYEIVDGEGAVTIKKEDLPDEFQVLGGSRDYHNTDDLGDFIEKYIINKSISMRYSFEKEFISTNTNKEDIRETKEYKDAYIKWLEKKNED